MKNMMIKRLMTLSLAIVGCLCFAQATKAAGEKFVIEQVFRNSSSTMGVYFLVNASGTLASEASTTYSPSSITDEATLRTATVNAIVSWAIANGYTGAVAADVLSVRPTISYNDLFDKPTKTFNNNVSRSLNSSYTVSSTRDVCASYSVNASWSLNALVSGSGSAFLEYSTDGGSNWITVNQVSKSLNLLSIAGGDDMNLVGCIPANGLVRLRTTTSNMTVSYVRGQEVLN